jgi:hypothetical protein
MPSPDPCPACLDTALTERDGSARVLTGDFCTPEELFRRFKPCDFCAGGEREALFQARLKADLERPL